MTSMSRSANRRTGPRPLGLHLGLASSTLASSVAALPSARAGLYPWMADVKEDAETLRTSLQEFELEHLMRELGLRGHQLVEAMLSGIQKYQTHPYERLMSQPNAIWSEGGASLLDYAPGAKAGAPIVFIVPSLVNKGYILDLRPERSFVRALADQGFRPLLMEWGPPGAEERDFTLDDYVLKRLVPALDDVVKASPNSPTHLLGYCMGGTLAVAQALYQQEKLTSLITLASPWNFHEGLGTSAKFLLSQEAAWQNVLDAFGEMPVDMLQAFFASLDPNLCLNKFSLFDRMDMAGDRAAEFVALEDWLNDGIPLAKNVAAACFSDWYGNNQPYCGNWSVGDKLICPQNLTLPVMIAVPRADKIVPPGSALGLAEQVANATVFTPPSGHIGMVAGGRAKEGLWADVIQWIKG